jgi:hypothetical protein
VVPKSTRHGDKVIAGPLESEGVIAAQGKKSLAFQMQQAAALLPQVISVNYQAADAARFRT